MSSKTRNPQSENLNEEYLTKSYFYTPRVSQQKTGVRVDNYGVSKRKMKSVTKTSKKTTQIKKKIYLNKLSKEGSRGHKLAKQKSEPVVKTARELMKAYKKSKNMKKIDESKVQSLKQNLKKRVMEYKTMHHVSASQGQESPVDLKPKRSVGR